MDAKRRAWAEKTDRRTTSRVPTKLKGKLFIASERRELDCLVANLSPEGAGIRCHPVPPRRTSVVLYVAGFGRFEGTTVQPAKDGTGIRFECSANKRKRITEQLKLFVKEGLTAVTSLRGSIRIQEVAIQSFRRQDGELVECEISDISLTGTALKTTGRPPVGEIIQLGRLAGRVMRHFENGIGVQFIDAPEAN